MYEELNKDEEQPVDDCPEVLPEKPKQQPPSHTPTRESEADETYPNSELLH